MNKMQAIGVEKITLNIGAGRDAAMLDKGFLLLQNITGKKPVKTMTNKRIPEWNLRPGLQVGCKITLRKKEGEELLGRLLAAKENMLSQKQFSDNGTVAFGIPEYIDIPGIEYDPKIGVIGFEVCVTFERPGYRIKKRKIKRAKIPETHRVKKQDAIEFITKKYNAKVE